MYQIIYRKYNGITEVVAEFENYNLALKALLKKGPKYCLQYSQHALDKLNEGVEK